MKHFSSDVLVMVPLLSSFLVTIIEPLGVLTDNIKCMGLLCRILSILQNHSVVTDAVYKALREAVDEHAVLFVRLYHSMVKIKFHHLMHLPEDLRRIGHILSCFVTERKHRDWKAVTLFAFRNFEAQTVRDFVNYMVEEFVSGRFKFKEFFLRKPKRSIIDGETLNFSQAAVLMVGEVRSKDIVCWRDNRGEMAVGEVKHFFAFDENDDLIYVWVRRLAAMGGDSWSLSNSRSCFVPAHALRANCVWGIRGPSLITALVPPVLL